MDSTNCSHPGCFKWRASRWKWEESGRTGNRRNLTVCEEHNICARCGESDSWEYQLCWDCDGTSTKPAIKCGKPGCPKVAAQREKNKEAGRLTFCYNHNLCEKCGKATDWSHLVCRDCDNSYKCAVPSCNHPPAVKMKGRMLGEYGTFTIGQRDEDLLRCAEHNTCSKCGMLTMWEDALCYECDSSK